MPLYLSKISDSLALPDHQATVLPGYGCVLAQLYQQFVVGLLSLLQYPLLSGQPLLHLLGSLSSTGHTLHAPSQLPCQLLQTRMVLLELMNKPEECMKHQIHVLLLHVGVYVYKILSVNCINVYTNYMYNVYHIGQGSSRVINVWY